MDINIVTGAKPFVTLIAGSMGAGKTTLLGALGKSLGNPPALIFDQYDAFTEWPQDMDQWMREGANPNLVLVPRLKADLVSLLDGVPITHPLDNRVIQPSRFILVEEPFGIERQEIAGLIDQVVYVDVPQDVCVVRMVQRAIGIYGEGFESEIEGEPRDRLEYRLKSAANWLRHYMWIRSGLKITEEIKKKADIIVDGLLPVGEMVQGVRAAILKAQMHP
jgi:uridine kinase